MTFDVNPLYQSHIYWTVHHCNSWKKKTSLMSLAIFYFTSYALNMFRTLIYPSSGAFDYSVELCWCFSLQHGYHSNPTTPKHQHTSNQKHTTNVIIQQNSRKLLMMDILMSETCWVHTKWSFSFSLQHGYHSNPTTPKHQHTTNQKHTTNVIIQQNSRKLLTMDILMSETCWAHKKWNKK